MKSSANEFLIYLDFCSGRDVDRLAMLLYISRYMLASGTIEGLPSASKLTNTKL
jgi:hypothetical protein